MKYFMFAAVLLCISAFSFQANFLAAQKQYPRVRTAIDEKEGVVNQLFSKAGAKTTDCEILIVAYKEEEEFEVYAKKKSVATFSKIATYEICNRSGILGPKRRQGDGQVPEGFYYINRFNPSSTYYLSLGINYPNQSDKIKSTAANLGGDIFIHGKCVTIGCLPMTDDKIQEIYMMAVYAKNCGQLKIPVYIFPFRMTNANIQKFAAQSNQQGPLTLFWQNLKVGADKFETTKKELNFTVNAKGFYEFK